MIFLYIVLICKILSKEIITLKFRQSNKNPTSKNPEDLLDNIKNNQINIDFYVGTPEKKISILLLFTTYPFSLVGDEVIGNYEKLSSSSSSLKKISDNITFVSYYYNEGYLSKEKFILKNINGKTIKVNDLNFILIKNLTSQIPGFIGLNVNDYSPDKIQDYNFIKALKILNIIDSYYFTIKYYKNEGEIIIGNKPHEYDDNYNKQYFQYVRNINNLNWGIKFDYIYLNNKKFKVKEKENFIFRIEYGLISAPFDYKIYIDEIFKEYINEGKCFSKLKNNNISYFYYCNNDLSNFPSLTFEINILEYNFTFEKNDLFEYSNGYYIFLIQFRKNEKNWLIGKEIFKKYQLVFNQDTKEIGFYTFIEKNNPLPFILIIIFIIIIIILSFIIYRKLTKNSQKKKASELIEEKLLNEGNLK